jgi:hypothetical protein
MTAKYILAILAVIFVGLGIARRASGRQDTGRQSRTFLIVGLMFGAVATWLWWA